MLVPNPGVVLVQNGNKISGENFRSKLCARGLERRNNCFVPAISTKSFETITVQPTKMQSPPEIIIDTGRDTKETHIISTRD